MGAKSAAVKALTGGIVHLFKQNKVNIVSSQYRLQIKNYVIEVYLLILRDIRTVMLNDSSIVNNELEQSHAVAQAVNCGLGSGQARWDLWWTKGQVFSEYFDFSCLASTDLSTLIIIIIIHHHSHIITSLQQANKWPQ